VPNPNMDIRKNPNATEAVMEFSLPSNELDTDMSVGEFGELIIPVEVIAKGDGKFTFRKVKSARTDTTFRKEGLNDMRDRIGVVKDLEK
jgi:hypothetical protein